MCAFLLSRYLSGSQEVLSVAKHVEDTAMAPPPAAANIKSDDETPRDGESEEEKVEEEDEEEESEFEIDTSSRQYIKYSQIMKDMKVLQGRAHGH